MSTALCTALALFFRSVDASGLLSFSHPVPFLRVRPPPVGTPVFSFSPAKGSCPIYIYYSVYSIILSWRSFSPSLTCFTHSLLILWLQSSLSLPLPPPLWHGCVCLLFLKWTLPSMHLSLLSFSFFSWRSFSPSHSLRPSLNTPMFAFPSSFQLPYLMFSLILSLQASANPLTPLVPSLSLSCCSRYRNRGRVSHRGQSQGC